MKLATYAAPDVSQDLQWRLTYGLLLPLFVISEGVTRLWIRYAADRSEPLPERRAWAAEARSQASIATSCALMAKSMLQLSERRNRPERLSRL
jgi:hypothetical protein